MKSSKTSYVKGTEGVYVIDITLLANRIELLLTTTQRVASPPHPTKNKKQINSLILSGFVLIEDDIDTFLSLFYSQQEKLFAVAQI